MKKRTAKEELKQEPLESEEPDREELKEPQEEQSGTEEASLGGFQSVEELLRSYQALEEELSKKTLKLKALEEELKREKGGQEDDPSPAEFYRAAAENEEVKRRVLGEYLHSLKGVPLLTNKGAGVSAPMARPKTIAEAGELALGYFRSKK